MTIERKNNFNFFRKVKFNPKHIEGYMFVLPALIIMFVFTVFPSLYVIVVSMTNWTLGSPSIDIVWLNNYLSFFKQPVAKTIFLSTFGYVLGSIIIVIFLGLILALLLNRKLPFIGLFRATIIIPWTLTAIIAGVMWRWMLAPELGILTYYLDKFDITIPWFTVPIAALAMLIIVEGWRSNGYGAMIFLAAMEGIDESLYEAANIDGATNFQSFKYITLPLLMPTMLVLTIVLTIRTLNTVDIILVVTGGGPFKTTETLAVNMWKESLSFLNFGYASSIAVIILIVNLILVIIYMKFWLKERF